MFKCRQCLIYTYSCYIHYVAEYSAKCIVMVLQLRVGTYLYTDYMVNQNAIYVGLVLLTRVELDDAA